MASDEYLRRYAEVYTMYTPRKAGIVVEWLKIVLAKQNPKGLLVDLGCGPAEMYPIVKQLGYSYLGVDTNPYILDRARRENPGIDVRHGQAQELPVKGQSANVVLMNMLVHSFDSLWALNGTIEEARRVLKKDGLLLLTMLGENKTENKIDPAFNAMSPGKPKPIVYTAEFPKGVLEMDVYHWPKASVVGIMEFFCNFTVISPQLYGLDDSVQNNKTYEMIVGIKN